MAMYENIRKLFKKCDHVWLPVSVSVEHEYVFGPYGVSRTFPYAVNWDDDSIGRMTSYRIESWVSEVCDECGKTRSKHYFGDLTSNGKKQDCVKSTDKRTK